MPLMRIALFLIASSSFGQVPALVPRLVMTGENVGATFWLSAPYIAVVNVRSADWLGSEVEVTPPKSMIVRLVRINGEIENVIKGDLSAGPVQFYFFANVPSEHGFTTVKYWLDSGRRYIVFLRKDGEVLRTMADVAPPELKILSGRHRDATSSREGPIDPGMAILYYSLTPTNNYDEGFAGYIPLAEASIRKFVATADIVRSLRALLEHPDRAIRDEACLTIAGRFRYVDPCLPQLLTSTDPSIQRQAKFWMQGRRESNAEIISLLRGDPISLSTSGKVDDLAADIEVFTWDENPAVRQQACATLRRLFPVEKFANCMSP
jgi:hypothetical protein